MTDYKKVISSTLKNSLSNTSLYPVLRALPAHKKEIGAGRTPKKNLPVFAQERGEELLLVLLSARVLIA